LRRRGANVALGAATKRSPSPSGSGRGEGRRSTAGSSDRSSPVRGSERPSADAHHRALALAPPSPRGRGRPPRRLAEPQRRATPFRAGVADAFPRAELCARQAEIPGH
jgi:hypothetical protein